MRRTRPTRIIATLALGALSAVASLRAAQATAATLDGRDVDDQWFDGRCVSTTYGAYDCQVRFHGDHVLMKIASAGIQIVGILDDEALSDPHDVLVNDPKRGVNWTLDCIDLRR